MLIIPLHRKIDWKHPPIATLFLIAINVMLFLLTQLDDGTEFAEALDYYRVSGLYELERGGYQGYLEEREALTDPSVEEDAGDEFYAVADQLVGIQTDPEFLRRLHHGGVIDPQSDSYHDWLEKRTRFESLYEAVTYIGYGLRTGHPTLLALFSHMFLHAGFAHLIGNMIFLLALGILVEILMGTTAFLLLYLLTGLGSAGLYMLLTPGSLVPGIGASGAISGLMGMYAVIYGLRKIRFFYSIGIYFDYVALPAIVLLPLWIGNELFQLLLYSESNINYLAHLGGLVSGAGAAAILKATVAPFDLRFLDHEAKDKAFESRLVSARACYENMDYRKALPMFRRLYQEGYKAREVIYLYYQCSRLSPDSEDFHRSARAVFAIPERDAATADLIREVYQDYVGLARPGPKLNARIVCLLADRFVEHKWIAEADRMMNIIRKKRLVCPKNSELVGRYAELLAEQGRNHPSG
ncbi:MAG: rhomboid family intramembrane serine protease [Candidatus Thiodiazotropha sp. (ex Epidulcina cf. delphinae)]|nr:rhomboid family intramembrane serine protease [Candidatus Thiodiazotropha sp. (ex Epidulcina cf. delphinae)]